jgi:hypothetical protein
MLHFHNALSLLRVASKNRDLRRSLDCRLRRVSTVPPQQEKPTIIVPRNHAKLLNRSIVWVSLDFALSSTRPRRPTRCSLAAYARSFEISGHAGQLAHASHAVAVPVDELFLICGARRRSRLIRPCHQAHACPEHGGRGDTRNHQSGPSIVLSSGGFSFRPCDGRS